MTKWIKTALTSVALLGVICVTPVLADPDTRTDCVGQMDEQVATLMNKFPKAIVLELPESVQKTVIENKGPPPDVAEPYSFVRIDRGDGLGFLVIHDKNCILMSIPGPINGINKFLGLTES